MSTNKKGKKPKTTVINIGSDISDGSDDDKKKKTVKKVN